LYTQDADTLAKEQIPKTNKIEKQTKKKKNIKTGSFAIAIRAKRR
jgi:hypothetical protein